MTMPTIAEAPRTRKLRYDDPRLLLTISQAAFELDRAARSKPANLDKAKQFLEFLIETISDEPGQEMHWVDPIAVSVFAGALQDSGMAVGMRTVNDVVKEALNVMKNIRHVAENGNTSELAALRDFCIAFGNSLLAWRAEHGPQPSSHPYRK